VRPTARSTCSAISGSCFAAAGDERFTPDVLIRRSSSANGIAIDHLLLRFLVIPQLRSGLLEQKRELWWMDTVPDWGPGRVDPFNPARCSLFTCRGTARSGRHAMVPLWNWNARTNFGLHRDGLNTSLTEIFLNSGIGNGASNSTIDRVGLMRLQKWVGGLKPPRLCRFRDRPGACRAWRGAVPRKLRRLPCLWRSKTDSRYLSNTSAPIAIVSIPGRRRRATASTG